MPTRSYSRAMRLKCQSGKGSKRACLLAGVAKRINLEGGVWSVGVSKASQKPCFQITEFGLSLRKQLS